MMVKPAASERKQSCLFLFLTVPVDCRDGGGRRSELMLQAVLLCPRRNSQPGQMRCVEVEWPRGAALPDARRLYHAVERSAATPTHSCTKAGCAAIA